MAQYTFDHLKRDALDVQVKLTAVQVIMVTCKTEWFEFWQTQCGVWCMDIYNMGEEFPRVQTFLPELLVDFADLVHFLVGGE